MPAPADDGGGGVTLDRFEIAHSDPRGKCRDRLNALGPAKAVGKRRNDEDVRGLARWVAIDFDPPSLYLLSADKVESGQTHFGASEAC